MKIAMKFLACGLLLASFSCVKDVKNAVDAVECAALIGKDFTSEDRACSEIIADINSIERNCGQFLDEDEKARLALAKENCTDN